MGCHSLLVLPPPSVRLLNVFFNIVVEVRASGPPSVVKAVVDDWLAVGKGRVACQPIISFWCNKDSFCVSRISVR